jgi:hypothetical protein
MVLRFLEAHGLKRIAEHCAGREKNFWRVHKVRFDRIFTLSFRRPVL